MCKSPIPALSLWADLTPQVWKAGSISPSQSPRVI